MKNPTSKEESRTRTSNIIMVDNEPDVNITIKIALEENGDFKVDTFNDAYLLYLDSNLAVTIWRYLT
jgi:hypothetical protein